MSLDTPGAGDTLARVQAQAQSEALRLFGDGPAVPWQAPVPVRPAVPRALLAMVAAAAVAATTWALGGSQPTVEGARMAIAAGPGPVEATQDDDIVDADPVPIPSVPSAGLAPRQDARPASLVVERAGATWHIAAANVSRLDAARRLAALSGSPLLGATELIAGTRPLDLRWQGRDLAGAWQAVLGPDLNFALQCRRDRCQAWIVAAAEPGANLSLPPAPPRVVAQAVEAAPRSDAGDVPDRLHHD